jgi:hypothetical protein
VSSPAFCDHSSFPDWTRSAYDLFRTFGKCFRHRLVELFLEPKGLSPQGCCTSDRLGTANREAAKGSLLFYALRYKGFVLAETAICWRKWLSLGWSGPKSAGASTRLGGGLVEKHLIVPDKMAQIVYSD